MSEQDAMLVKISEMETTLKQILRALYTPAHHKNSVHSILWEDALMESSAYVKPRLSEAVLFREKVELWEYALSKSNDIGLCLEFGVFRGESINYFAAKYPSRRFFGFDSFMGLAEDWFGHHATKGRFNLNGELPNVLQNVTLIPGWFENSLPQFLAENPGELSFVHIDGDTYQAAKTILEQLFPRLKPGVVIVFDEYYGYPNWQNGEYKAWQEAIENHNLSYKYIAFATNQVAIVIT